MGLFSFIGKQFVDVVEWDNQPDGRYVGVEIEGDDMSQEEFNSLLKVKSSEFEKLNSVSASIEKNILVGLKELVKGK